jgi:DNA-binding transcriptional MerR regulator
VLIGELAQRLRVTPRTLRHWESVGLLPPAAIDPANGYRTYGAAELLRGVQIEQLRAAGLSLNDIGAVLSGEDLSGVLGRRRAQLVEELRRIARELSTLDALRTPATPTLVHHPLTELVSVTVPTSADALAGCIRTHVQRLRRRIGATQFAARFALEPDGIDRVEVAALVAGADTWAAYDALEVESVGSLDLLPLAYDAALTHARAGGLPLTGTVQETYTDLGRTPRTTIAVLVSASSDRRSMR